MARHVFVESSIDLLEHRAHGAAAGRLAGAVEEAVTRLPGAVDRFVDRHEGRRAGGVREVVAPFGALHRGDDSGLRELL